MRHIKKLLVLAALGLLIFLGISTDHILSVGRSQPRGDGAAAPRWVLQATRCRRDV